MRSSHQTRPSASGRTALATLVATGLPGMSDAIASVLASQSLPATAERPYLRAYSFVRQGPVPITTSDGRRATLPARHITLLRGEGPPGAGAYYGRVIVPAWGEDRLYGPCDDCNDVARALDRDHVADLTRARAPSDAGAVAATA